jgi:hypothetical protein
LQIVYDSGNLAFKVRSDAVAVWVNKGLDGACRQEGIFSSVGEFPLCLSEIRFLLLSIADAILKN